MIELVSQPFKCNHCNKSFMQEKTLIAHMCEKKRRFLQKDEKRVQAGYMAFNRWWELAQGIKKRKSYEDFCETSYYNAFVKFGSFINNVNPIYPEKFVDFVIKSGIKLDHWCRDELYDQYLFDMIKVEPVESAMQRSIQNMMEWADEHNAIFSHYFIYVSLNRATYDIRNGNISPWIILNTSSGKDMIKKMSDEQLEIISPTLDIPFWLRKFKEIPADVALVKEICREVGID